MKRASYKEIREQIQDGDILLCSGNYPLSQLIKKVTNSQYSHVAFVLWFNDRLMVLESVESVGVRMVPLSFYTENYGNKGRPYDGDIYISRHNVMSELLSSPETSKTEMTHLIGKALDLMGKQYGTQELARIALRLTTGIGRQSEDDSYICSEYVADCFAENGITFSNIDGFVMPKQIAEDSNVAVKFQIISNVS